MTEIMRSRYCRICSKGAKRFLYQMTEEIRENFHSITNVHLIKSDVFSNLICSRCDQKIDISRKYRDELIANELLLLRQLESNTLIDMSEILPVHVKIEAQEISDNDEGPIVGDFVEEMREFSTSDEWVQNDSPSTSRAKCKKKRKTRENHKKSRLKMPKNALKTDTLLDDEIENLPKTDDGKVICTKCFKPVVKIYYRQHIERTHLGIKNYVCDQCDKRFYKYSSIESHMNQHLKIQPFTCPHDCGKHFYNRTSLRTHEKHNHSEEFEFICEKCALRFKERYLLQEHISTKHDGLRFKCNYPGCTSEYYSNNGLKKHIDSTHESREEACEICGQIYRTGQQMYQHKRLKHSSMNFECHHCGKRFATAALMKTHEKLHIGQKDHICNICNSRYHIRRNLTRHIQVAHRKSKFFCKIPGCNAVLCNKDNFRTHVRKVHHTLSPAEMESLLEEIKTMKPDYIEGENEIVGE